MRARRGKGLRAAMVLAAAEAVGRSTPAATAAAAAVELVHAFTLVHDDVMDRSDHRHGAPTVWRLWGVDTAILLGDALQACATRLPATALEPRHRAEAVVLLQDTVLEPVPRAGPRRARAPRPRRRRARRGGRGEDRLAHGPGVGPRRAGRRRAPRRRRAVRARRASRRHRVPGGRRPARRVGRRRRDRQAPLPRPARPAADLPRGRRAALGHRGRRGACAGGSPSDGQAAPTTCSPRGRCSTGPAVAAGACCASRPCATRRSRCSTARRGRSRCGTW
nr:polyprenyl synthetase family protein [Angustibacter aerolatus]